MARGVYVYMRLITIIATWVVLLAAPMAGLSQEPAAGLPSRIELPAAEQKSGGPEHGLPQAAQILGDKGQFFITNSMIVTWVVAAGLIIFAQVATRNIREVPSGAQNFWEWLVESLYEFLEGIIGPELVKRTFWFFGTIFIFILATNWFGLIPGVGTIGWGVPGPHGFEVTRPLLRGGNADLNMTFAMSMIFMVLWVIWAVQSQGVGGVLVHIFGAKGESSGVLRVLMVLIFFLVGILEIFSIAFRPISLSFRLFGNIYAGENMMEAMSNLIPGLGWLLPVPFYFMELLVGIVQALVFTLLTAVFTMLICMHDEEGHATAPARH
ncbi:MAG TPA: F0F1 ATP synthase subunit A [Verrucomicrobiae bacterium]|nr:F0F1 ATP synthase subunit A [Verrucomicrobiae bacterium]